MGSAEGTVTARRAIAIALLALLASSSCGGGASDETDWMASLPDSANLASLSIPGTHDSGAMYEPLAGLAKAQDLTFAQQLDAGVRYFDVRCRDVDDKFLIYHGGIDQMQTFDVVLATFDTFLTAHPHETVIMSVKEETLESGETMPFDAAFMAYVAAEPARWYTGATVPALGDGRGKIVLLRRFDTTDTAPLGIDATNWADNASFAITGSDATLAIEDNYIVGSGSAGNDAKWADITANLGSAAAAGASSPALFLTYTSGYQTVHDLPVITLVSDDIDARLDTYFADPANAHVHLGAVVMDFVVETRAAAIIDTNAAPP
jgi:1-phosphatidylinositol phosphodiesterase